MKNNSGIINMKKNILLLLILPLFFTAASAQAQEWYPDDACSYEDTSCVQEKNFYGKFLSGANFLQNSITDGNKASYQTGYIIAGSLGYCWNHGLRLEAEYAYRRNSIKNINFFQEGSSKNGNFQTSSYMVNLLWDLPLASWNCAFWNIKPFIGTGIGYDSQHMHACNSRVIFNQRWSHFSWQMMAGLAYPLFCNTDITLEYKFHQGSCHFNNHSLGVGLVYKFGCFW